MTEHLKNGAMKDHMRNAKSQGKSIRTIIPVLIGNPNNRNIVYGNPEILESWPLCRPSHVEI